MTPRPPTRRALPALPALVLLLLLTAATVPARAAGLDVHAGGDAADVGLPLYPGATKVVKKGDDQAAFSFALWGDSFGIKLVAVKYRSDADVDTVAAFYRDALPRFGAVLDCSANRPHAKASAPAASSGADKPLTCDDDTVAAGGRLYKVGTEKNHRVVKIMPFADGAEFQLVLVDTRGID